MVMNQDIPNTTGLSPGGDLGPAPGGDEDTMVTNQLMNIISSLPLPVKKEMLQMLSQAGPAPGAGGPVGPGATGLPGPGGQGPLI